MKENVLETFTSACEQQIIALFNNRASPDLIRFMEQHKNQALEILNRFFDPNDFEFSLKSSVTEVWLKYHMFQSTNNIGSMVIVFDTCHLIKGMSECYGEKKVKEYLCPKGVFNERQLRSSLLEFFTALIFKKNGFDTFFDVNSTSNVPLDVVVTSHGHERLIECHSIQESKVLYSIFWLSLSITRFIHKCAQNRTQSISLCQSLPFSYYLAAKTTDDFNRNKEGLLREIKAFVLKRNKLPSPSITTKSTEHHVEDYSDGLYEHYMESLDSYKHVLIGRCGASYAQSLPNVPIKQEGKIGEMKDYDERLKIAIEDKSRQHKRKNYKSKLYVFEFETFNGPSLQFDFDKLDLGALEGLLESGETVWVIHKNTRGDKYPERRIEMVSKDSDQDWKNDMETVIESNAKNSVRIPIAPFK